MNHGIVFQSKLKIKPSSSRLYVLFTASNQKITQKSAMPLFKTEMNRALTSNKRKTLASAPTSSLSEKISDTAF